MRALALPILLCFAACGSSSGGPGGAGSGGGGMGGAAGAGANAGQGGSATSPYAEPLAALFATYAKELQFNGAALVAVDGAVAFRDAFGVADATKKRDNEIETVFRIASVSKSITSVAVWRQHQLGHLDINAPLTDYIPEYPAASAELNGRKVLVRDLLSHQSGLPHWALDTPLALWLGTRAIAPQEMLDALVAAALPLEFEPGTDYEYNNSNFVLAGLILERTDPDGLGYDALMRKRFFEPAGMLDTGAVLPSVLEPRFAKGLVKVGRRFVNYADSWGTWWKDDQYTKSFGAGQLYATVDDLMRWHGVLSGTDVLTETTKEAMWSTQHAIKGTGNCSMKGSAYSHGFCIKDWSSSSGSDATRVAFHDGAAAHGYSSFFLHGLSRDIAIVLLTNPFSSDNLYRDPLIENVLEVLAGEQPKLPTFPKTPPALLANISGDYGSGGGLKVVQLIGEGFVAEDEALAAGNLSAPDAVPLNAVDAGALGLLFVPPSWGHFKHAGQSIATLHFDGASSTSAATEVTLVLHGGQKVSLPKQ